MPKSIRHVWTHLGLGLDWISSLQNTPYSDSKVHDAYMWPTWGRQDSGVLHVGPMNLAIRVGSAAFNPMSVQNQITTWSLFIWLSLPVKMILCRWYLHAMHYFGNSTTRHVRSTGQLAYNRACVYRVYVCVGSFSWKGCVRECIDNNRSINRPDVVKLTYELSTMSGWQQPIQFR